MSKPNITAAEVIAAYEVLDNSPVPDRYYRVSAEEQRQMRLDIVRQALIAASLSKG